MDPQHKRVLEQPVAFIGLVIIIIAWDKGPGQPQRQDWHTYHEIVDWTGIVKQNW